MRGREVATATAARAGIGANWGQRWSGMEMAEYPSDSIRRARSVHSAPEGASLSCTAKRMRRFDVMAVSLLAGSPLGLGYIRRLLPAPAEVGAADLRDIRDLVRRPVDDHPADVEDGHVVGDPPRLLDQQDPETVGLQLLDDGQHLLDDDRGEAPRGLVEQQDPWLRHQGLGD